MAERHVLGVSGGKDSAALAVYMRDKHPELDIDSITDFGPNIQLILHPGYLQFFVKPSTIITGSEFTSSIYSAEDTILPFSSSLFENILLLVLLYHFLNQYKYQDIYVS